MGLARLLLGRQLSAARTDSIEVHKRRLEKAKQERLAEEEGEEEVVAADVGAEQQGVERTSAGPQEQEPQPKSGADAAAEGANSDSESVASVENVFNKKRVDSILLAKERIAKAHQGPSKLGASSSQNSTLEGSGQDQEAPVEGKHIRFQRVRRASYDEAQERAQNRPQSAFMSFFKKKFSHSFEFRPAGDAQQVQTYHGSPKKELQRSSRGNKSPPSTSRSASARASGVARQSFGNNNDNNDSEGGSTWLAKVSQPLLNLLRKPSETEGTRKSVDKGPEAERRAYSFNAPSTPKTKDEF